MGLSGDDYGLYGGVNNNNIISYYKNQLSAQIDIGSVYWNELYNYIFVCNSAIEGLTNSTTLTPRVKEQLLGEALFMRSLFYFYLTNLYGDVPLVVSTDYKVNASLTRVSQTIIFRQNIRRFD